MDKSGLTKHIKAEALRLGFDVCGIAKAEAISDESIALYNRWTEEGRHGSMQYLERNCNKRFDPTLLVEGCCSIISVALNYAPVQRIEGISCYAVGNDYHKTIKDRLFLLLKSINEITPTKGRPFCDSAPVLERYWAVKAGLGWIGRNRQLILPGKGSFYFLGELLIDQELEYDVPYQGNHCGSCTKCTAQCPTGALSDKGFDARKCLSYLTIEHRGELPDSIGEKMGKCFYGCDRCLDACPHNRFSVPCSTPELQPNEALLKMHWEKWANLTEEEYRSLFAESAVERCGYEQLMRNIKAVEKR